MENLLKKVIFVLSLVAFHSISAHEHKIIEIDFCGKMSINNNIKLSLLLNGDTLVFPKVGVNKWLSPIDYYGLDTTQFEAKKPDGSNRYITILLEDCNFIYEFQAMAFLSWSDVKYGLCVSQKKSTIGLIKDGRKIIKTKKYTSNKNKGYAISCDIGSSGYIVWAKRTKKKIQ